MDLVIRRAMSSDAAAVSAVLRESAAWLEQRGIPLWQQSELLPEVLAPDIEQGFYVLALLHGTPVGAFKFQPEDPVFWPDATPGEAAYVHRVAVRRAHAGGQLSLALLNWAVQQTRVEHRQFLRLDCDLARPRLRAVYERFGFVHHSDRQIGPYHVARYQLSVTHAVQPALAAEEPASRGPG